MIRNCRDCGEDFDLDYRGGRPRERCFTCQPPGLRVVAEASGEPRRRVWRSSPAPEVLEVCERSVRQRGAEASIAGALLLLLARSFAAGGHTAGGLVALSRELLRTWAEVRNQVPEQTGISREQNGLSQFTAGMRSRGETTWQR